VNSLLMKHRPKDMPKEKWEQTWASMGGSLEPLADTLREMAEGLGDVHPTDFDCPNHYAKLVYEQTRKQVLLDILEMLPK
jgi:hypothetical protein